LSSPSCNLIFSAVHVIRVHAICDKNKTVLAGLGALFIAQVAVTAVCCAFYHCRAYQLSLLVVRLRCLLPAVPLLEGQGCIAGPRSKWVGVYWAAITLFYTTSVRPTSMLAFEATD
jgi:hypothetical protein